MPQFKRRVAFSAKKKKEQLQARRNKEAVEREIGASLPSSPGSIDDVVVKTEILRSDDAQVDHSSIYQQEIENLGNGPSTAAGRSRYQLKFKKDTHREKLERQKLHMKCMKCLDEIDLEMTSEEYFPSGLDYPKRPNWSSLMSKKELDQSENRYFRKFCEEIDINFIDSTLSKYELNLETWRQLWRVSEISDILLIIVDARFPVVHFPPYLYHDLVEVYKKDVILVLNKCDLLTPSLVLAWKKYFENKYPCLTVVPFYSLEGKKHVRGLLKMAYHSSLNLVSACEKLIQNQVDISSWRTKIKEETSSLVKPDIPDVTYEKGETNNLKKYQKFDNGILTIGTIGNPNVGKSSLINALMGKKVVSVSRTPGHTKHFQTIYITKTVRLCDCPGLVFPSICPIELQVISGGFPIAQYNDPLSVLYYVGTLINIPVRMKLESASSKSKNEWTAYSVAEAWAIRRGYIMNVKGGRPDINRASNEILRFTLSGTKNLVTCLRPPDYQLNKGELELDPETENIQHVQGIETKEEIKYNVNGLIDSDSEDDDSSNNSEEDYCQTLSKNKFALLETED